MACDPNVLLAQASCLLCNLAGQQLQAAKLVFLCAWANGTTMPCDADTLMSQAKCFLCKFTGDDEYDAAMLVFLCAIRDGVTPVSCDPDNLLSEAKCLLCTIPSGALKAAQLAVLCDIVN